MTAKTLELSQKVFRIMKGANFPWFIAGGWAIDLYLSRITREHSDIEIGIFRADQLSLRRYLKNWVLQKVEKQSAERAGQLEIWHETEFLKLPTHEIHATRNLHPNQTLRVCPGTPYRNTREYSTLNLAELEVLLNERDDTHWIYRRNSQIKRDLSKTILHTKTGIPYLAPEIVFLFKSKNTNPDDELDFNNTIKHLTNEQLAWFAASIDISSPDHPWLDRLA